MTHIGIGLGMMLDGGNVVLFMKQLDFLPLGIDQSVNTFTPIRAFCSIESLGSFTIFVNVCDHGYQGPQSSLNCVNDFSSMVNINAYCLNASEDVSNVISDQFVTPGFRMVCTSQRLFGTPALDIPIVASAGDNSLFKYRSGNNLTVACYNFALRDGLELAEQLSRASVQSDLFHVNYVPGMDTEPLIESCSRTGSLLLLDDSKAIAKLGDVLVTELQSRGSDIDVLSLGRRGCTAEGYGVGEDRFIPDYDTVWTFVCTN